MRLALLTPALLFCLACAGGGGSDESAPKGDEHAEEVSRPVSDNARPAADIEGSYGVTGTNPDGSAYEGSLSVARTGAVYSFHWETGQPYDGVGVVDGNHVAVGWGGESCGGVIYRIGDDGSLYGRWALMGTDAAGTESASRSGGGSGLAGSYSINGTNADGSEYTGSLDITDAGETVQLRWEAGGTSLGEGIVMDNVLGTSYGTNDCGVAVYRIQGNTLDGVWTVYGAGGTGTERAVKE
jgi:hypothetical protein